MRHPPDDDPKAKRGVSRGEALSNSLSDLLKGSVEIITEYRCARHPDRPATALCEDCGADLCSDCVTIRDNRALCDKCTGALGRALGGKGVTSVLTRALIHPFTVALVLVALLAGAFISFGKIHRKGLLGKAPENAVAAEEQFRLRTLLYVQKADRIEAYADMLREAGRLAEAETEYGRARSIYRKLARETEDRWEHPLLILARARILEKMGERAYAEGLYRTLASLPGRDKTYPVIAEFRLAEMLERTDPEEAADVYKGLLKDIKFVPDTLSRVMHSMAHSPGAYNYETRMRLHTRTEFDFESARVKALLNMGRLLLSLGHTSEGRYRLSLAAEVGRGTEAGEKAKEELRKLYASEEPETVPEEAGEEPEISITRF